MKEVLKPLVFLLSKAFEVKYVEKKRKILKVQETRHAKAQSMIYLLKRQ